MVIRNNTKHSQTHTQIEKKERKEWKGRENERKERILTII